VQKTRKRFGPLKWLLLCIVAAFLGALAWITFEDVSTLSDPRSAASHAVAIVLCNVHREQPNPHFVVEEIWKPAPGAHDLSVGSSISFAPPGFASARTLSKAVVFFRRPLWSRTGKLQKNAVFYFDGDVVLHSPRMTISELKAICVATPGT
jgi:hypothetical protein